MKKMTPHGDTVALPRTSWTLCSLLLVLVLFAGHAPGQTIQDIWETKSDKSSLLKHLSSSANVEFGSGGVGDAEIEVDAGTVYQTIFGFGATMTDASAYTLNKLKASNSGTYSELLKSMFDVTLDANAAGMNYIRVAIGASDFSPNVYSYCDKEDTSLGNFSVNSAPSYLFSVLQDIKAINENILIHIVPWSPPGWMKDTNSMKAGNFLTEHTDHMAAYLLKSAQAFQSKGLGVYAISIQNEPESQNPTLPSTLYTTEAQAAVAVSLRKRLDSNGLQSVKIIGYDHNWDDASTYATQLMKEDGAMDAFDGVAFHCYAGKVEQQVDWHNAFPSKELYFTECTGVPGSDWWSDIQYYMTNIFIGGIQYWSQTGLMWNFAVDPEGNPKLPGASSCGKGCRGVVQVSDGEVQLNQEYYAIAHAAKAVLPQTAGGQFGQRVNVSKTYDSFTVGAYATKGSNGTRISLVVMNAGSGNVKTAIKSGGKTATYSFPVGLTTMSWSA